MKINLGFTLSVLASMVACAPDHPPAFIVGSTLEVPYSGASVGPRISIGADGAPMLSWMERQDNGARLKVARFSDQAWGPAIEVVSDSRMFVNWADLPSVTAIGPNHWIAHWLSYSVDLGYAYDIKIAQSFDQGRQWTAAMSPHDDGTPTEHGFVSVFRTGLDAGLIWLDGRKTVNVADDDPTVSGMTLRTATLSPEGALGDEQEMDSLVCDCCQTSVAVSSEGPVAVYRDRTANEIRDIYVSRFRDGRWQEGTAIAHDNWAIAGCPVNGPAIAASGDFVAVAWFTAAGGTPLVKASLSKDGGQNFDDPVVVSSQQPSGHTGIAYLGDSVFAVSWLEAAGESNAIQVRSLNTAGDLGEVLSVGNSDISYNVPQMQAYRGELLLAWTDGDYEASRIESKRVLLAGPAD